MVSASVVVRLHPSPHPILITPHDHGINKTVVTLLDLIVAEAEADPVVAIVRQRGVTVDLLVTSSACCVGVCMYSRFPSTRRASGAAPKFVSLRT